MKSFHALAALASLADLSKMRRPFQLRPIMTTEQLQAESCRVFTDNVPRYMPAKRRKGDRPAQELPFIKFPRGKFSMHGSRMRSAFPVA